MSVLVEGISVILRAEPVISRFPGGWDAFKAQVPNRTLCADGELIRVGFMVPQDAEAYIQVLGKSKLTYLRSGKAIDLVVADQRRGLCAPADWVEFGTIDWEDDVSRKMSACRLVGSKVMEMVTPEGWSYEDSLSAQYLYLSQRAIPEYLDFLRHEDGLDVYRDLRDGKEVYVGRVDP